MARRRGVVALALVGLLAGCTGSSGDAARDGDGRPNVVVLVTDDQTLESIRVMPCVRRTLAERGATFSRAFVSSALCCPSRATFLTGQYVHNHGVLGNRPPTGGYARLDAGETLPVWLQRAGYLTMHVGKFLNRYGIDGPPTEVPPGWDEWHASVDPSTYEYYGTKLNENGTLRSYPASYSTDLYARRAEELIGRASTRGAPFFLFVGFLAPHEGGPREADDPTVLETPAPARRHRDRFEAEPLPATVRAAAREVDLADKPSFLRARAPIGAELAEAIEENYRQRLESLLAVDEAVVSIIDALRARSDLADTLVIFTSDNGFFHGEHRMESEKMLAYEPSIRVPLILRGPGVPAGVKRRRLVTNADLAPTILDLAGASATKQQDGMSLTPLLANPRRRPRRDLLIEGPDGFTVEAYRAVRTERHLYVRYVNGERELYDLRRDPHQLRSLHDDPAHDRLERALARRLRALADCAGRECRSRP